MTQKLIDKSFNGKDGSITSLPIKELKRFTTCKAYFRISNWLNKDSFRIWIKDGNSNIIIDSDFLKELVKIIEKLEKEYGQKQK